MYFESGVILLSYRDHLLTSITIASLYNIFLTSIVFLPFLMAAQATMLQPTDGPQLKRAVTVPVTVKTGHFIHN